MGSKSRTFQFRLLLFVAASAFVMPVSAAKPVEALHPQIQTEVELESVIARLSDERTRLAAIGRLFRFSRRGIPLGGGFGPVDPLVEKAKTALEPYRDLTIAEQAMRSDSPTLRVWGLFQLSNFDEQTLKSWRHLIPLVRKLAADASADVRSNAQRTLMDQPGQGEFLAHCAEVETSAGNIMRIVGTGRLNPHLMRLLNHADPQARRSALLNIGFNSRRAKVWQVEYSDRVVDRVFDLSHSAIESDRAGAVYALDDLQSRYPERVRSRMLEMAGDPAEDVRWRVAAALGDVQDQLAVREVLEELLHDESTTVRYFAISSLGVEEHIDELRKIAADDEPSYARDAARRWLERFETTPEDAPSKDSR